MHPLALSVVLACVEPSEETTTTPGTTVTTSCDPSAPPPPSTLPTFEVTTWDRDRSEMSRGYVLATVLDDVDTFAVTVLDACGQARWWYEGNGPDDQLMRAWVSRDRSHVYVGGRHQQTGIDIGEIRRVRIDTGAVDQITRALDHHHEFVEMPDGRLGYLSRERVPDKWFGGEAPLVADVVRIAEPGSSDPGEHDQVIHLLDDYGFEPFWPCNHMNGRFLPGFLDWTHTNSLVHHDETGQWTLGVRHFDSVMRFGADGALRWVLGGAHATLVPEDGARPLRHAHFSEVWHDGMLAFDNRNHEPDTPTRIVELAIDEEAGTFREVWTYDHPSGGRFLARGDVRRLPGGNLLVTWSGNGQIWELTRDGEVVWAVDTNVRVLRVQHVPDWPSQP